MAMARDGDRIRSAGEERVAITLRCASIYPSMATAAAACPASVPASPEVVVAPRAPSRGKASCGEVGTRERVSG